MKEPPDGFDAAGAAEKLTTLESKYRGEGLEPVRWHFPTKEGCRACGDMKKGPWGVMLMSTRLPEVKKALVFPVTLCASCGNDRKKCDEVAELAARAFLDRN